MQYVVCCVPVSPLRSEPSHKSEMKSQQLFGEKSIIKEAGIDNWVKIVLKYDGYEGWCQFSHLAEIADITGFSIMQVKSYIQNGKRNLKLMIEGGN